MENKELQYLLGKRIKFLRESKNLTQLDVSSSCNIEQSNFARIETGKTNATVYSLYLISRALGVELEELVKLK
jgi:transcriptional regulator with XRE-family HTH domain